MTDFNVDLLHIIDYFGILKSCWSGIEGLIVSQSQQQVVSPLSLFVWEALCWSEEPVTFWSWILKSFRRHRFLIELPSLSVLFSAGNSYCVDLRDELPVLSNSPVNNNISKRLIRSLSFCLRLDRYLSVWKSSIFIPYQRSDNFFVKLYV